jgi:pimeloyl-ACP methyl ester carboxylesterase
MMLAAERETPIARMVMNDLGARVAVAALRRIGGYLRINWRFGSMDEANAHLREILAPFGKLTDPQWEHLTEHSVVQDEAGLFRFHYDPAIGTRFGIPLWADVLLWHLWEKVACPVLILRGAESDLLSEHTVALMLQRGAAARAGKVSTATIDGCGHAPALMSDEQVALVADFIFDGSCTADLRSVKPSGGLS